VGYIEEKTGYQVEIKGNMSLKLFPYLGLSLSQVEVKNPEGSKGPYLPSVEEAAFSLELMPLLQKNIKLDSVSLNKITMNLEKSKSGQENWQAKEIQAKSGNINTAPQVAISDTYNNQTLLLTSVEGAQKEIHFEIARINLNNGQINFSDLQKN